MPGTCECPVLFWRGSFAVILWVYVINRDAENEYIRYYNEKS